MSGGFDELLGNSRLKAMLSSAIASGTLTNALLVEGARGTGKKTLAHVLACALACTDAHPPCMACPACRKIIAGNCPDVVFMGVPEDKKTFPVSAVRTLREDAFILPSELEFKMYVLTDADRMTVEAQNAFLKVLEEPPSYIYFVLLCQSSAPILPTVKSRTQNVRMQRFDDDTLAEHLTLLSRNAAKLSEDNPRLYSGIVKAANGSIGDALSLVSVSAQKKLAASNDALKELFVKLNSSCRAEFLACSGAIPTEREQFRDYLGRLIAITRDLLRSKSPGGSMLVFADSDECAELARGYSEGALVSIFDLLASIRDDSDSNANMNLSITNLMLSLWEAAHR